MAFLSTISRDRLTWVARRRWLRWLLAAALLGPAGAAAPAPSTSPDEYQVKGLLLFHFAQFVEWPARAFHDAEAPLVIGVLGEDPFGAYLDDPVKGEKIGSRPLVVRRFRRVDDITDCQILFISRSESAQLDQIMTRLRCRSVLTVGDTDSFIRKGGMVRFVTENSKIRLHINVEAAKAADLTISSKLLRPATIVTADED
jgi:hypothetical protein